MNVKQKAILATFIVLIIVTLIVNIIFVPIYKQLFETLVIDYTNSFVQRQLVNITTLFDDRLDYIKSRADLFSHQDLLYASNKEFDLLSKPEIEKKLVNGDMVWNNNNDPLVKEVLNNKLSQEMTIDFKSGNYYIDNYGYDLYPEVFLTNKYGATVATTNKTSDYNQSDEDWWIKAKENGVYIESLVYDESSATSDVILSIAMRDSSGNFSGVVKATLNMRDVINSIIKSSTFGKSQFDPLDVVLLTNDFKKIYPQNIDNETLLSEFISRHNNSLLNDSQKNGVIISDKCLSDVNQKCIYNFASLKNYYNLDLYLIVSRTETAIMQTLNYTRLLSLANTSLSIFISLGIFLFLLSLISKQIFVITDIINQISFGNFAARIKIITKDEFGLLAERLNRMLDTITKTRVFEDTVLKNLEYGVLLLDKDRKITFANDAFKKLLGYDIKYYALVGKTYTSILQFYREGDGPLEAYFIEDAYNNIKKSETSNIEIINKNNLRIPVACSASPIIDNSGNFIGTIIVIRDVTEYTRISKAKSEFVSIASHQLRTPLASIRWYAEALLKGIGNVRKPTDDQVPYINTILDSTTRIINLVNALLNVSRLEVGTFTIQPEKAKLHDLMFNAIQNVKQKIEQKQLKLSTYCSPEVPEVMVDPSIISIIFENLVSNAVTYTPENGSLTIEGKLIEDPQILKRIPRYKGPKGILIKVSDTGLGIPEAQQKDIFTKLFRADNIKKISESGTGLGLYTCRLILDNIGGAIWFESEENKGSTFYVLLPYEGMQERHGSRKLEFIK